MAPAGNVIWCILMRRYTTTATYENLMFGYFIVGFCPFIYSKEVIRTRLARIITNQERLNRIGGDTLSNGIDAYRKLIG